MISAGYPDCYARSEIHCGGQSISGGVSNSTSREKNAEELTMSPSLVPSPTKVVYVPLVGLWSHPLPCWPAAPSPSSPSSPVSSLLPCTHVDQHASHL